MYIILQLSNTYTDANLSNSPHLEPQSVPSAEYINTDCEKVNRQHFHDVHVWKSHRQHVALARLF